MWVEHETMSSAWRDDVARAPEYSVLPPDRARQLAARLLGDLRRYALPDITHARVRTIAVYKSLAGARRPSGPRVLRCSRGFVGEYSRWAEERVGPKRIHWVLPIRDLVAARAPIAFGTDYTASDSGDPIANLAGAVARQSSAGVPAAGWYPAQKLDMETTLRSISAGPAFAAFQERVSDNCR
jgi:amidohydrolase family protein